ncbi:MAG: flagellar biosynthesis protein FlhF [Azoarcus sp.]|jgi:flagellar biosynthesis protein FlhF|nr:flagellar biosynthesis protein FlhF [Azoarcus sp.]
MDVRRYYAPTAREALRALKAELGGDALVLSNRAVPGGVEILALPPEALDVKRAAARPAPVRPRPPVSDDGLGDDFHVTLSGLAAGAIPRHVAAQAPRREPPPPAPEKRAPVIRPFSPPRLEEHNVLGELLDAGFSTRVARLLAEAVEQGAAPAVARAAVGAALGRRLRLRPETREIVDGGGVFALVGPTGAGKTTTVAKLAARFVTRHGADKLALVTTDGYRIGAQEQLRIYGRILGVPVFSARNGAELRQTLLDLRDKRMVLIDTMGMSQRDRMVEAQAAMLADGGEVRRLLLLNATCRGDTLDDVVRAFGGTHLAGVVLSKVDEAATLAPALDVAVRHELELCYVTNGQRVPEDLLLPERGWLWRQALPARADDSPWRLDGHAVGAMFAAQGA